MQKKIFAHIYWVLFLIIVGYWLVYSNTTQRFIIDFPRITFVGSVLLVLASGFGAHVIYIHLFKYRIMLSLAVVSFLIYVATTFTANNRWAELDVRAGGSKEMKIKPRPPTNTILKNDELVLFEKLTGENLVSDPWKSTVLAVTRKIKPIFLKSGTLSDMSPIAFETFLADPCGHLAKYWRLKFYLYLPRQINLKCEGLTEVGQSKEGFVLYSHNGKM